MGSEVLLLLQNEDANFLNLAEDYAVEDILANANYRYLKFIGNGEYNPLLKGISVNIPRSIESPEETGFRRGRGPTILFD